MVTTRSVLIYVSAKQRAFNEFYRVVKPNGRLSIFEPINRFGFPELPHMFWGYDVTSVMKIAQKVKAVYRGLQPPDTDPMLDFHERDMITCAEHAGFKEIHLELQAEIKASEECDWNAFLRTAGNPKIPTLGEAMRVLVVGGTGFIGGRIVRKLLERGDSVTLLTRGRVRPAFWGQIEALVGDRRDKARFNQLVRGRQFDVVIDNLAYGRSMVESAIQAFDGRIGHYLLCSSGAVYRDYMDWRRYRLVYENEVDLTYEGDLAYAEGKREAEHVLWASAAAHVPFTILRPSVVEGPEDPSGRTWFWVQRVADGQEVLVPQTVPVSIFRHVFVDDVAEAFVRAVGNSAAFFKAYNLAGEEILALPDYVRAIAAAMGFEVKVVLARLEWIRQQPGLSNFSAPFVGERFIQDIAAVKCDLRLSFTPMGNWFPQTVSWFLHEYRGKDSVRYERRVAEVTAARGISS